MPPTPYLLLTLSTSPASDRPDTHARCLNAAGRWAVHGTADAPLLAWHADQADEARAAAERAAQAQGRRVEVLSRGDAAWEEGREIRLFSEAAASALLGAAAPSAARARRLRVETDKLEAFCLVVRQASAATDHEAFMRVSRAAGKALQVRFGGGSVSSASTWLAGPKGQEALQHVLAGEAELAGRLTLREIAETVALAQQTERLRLEAEHPGTLH